MIYNNLFEIDLDDLVVQLLPMRLRKPKQVAWLRLLITLFKRNLKTLKQERELTLYRLTHNYQVGSIEKVLNDAFDFVDRRIRLSEGNYIVPTAIYQPTENKPLVTPYVIFKPDELAAGNGDFIVNIPKELNLSEGDIIRLTAIVRYYALDDKAFKIEMI